jgi:hypothetical protein
MHKGAINHNLVRRCISHPWGRKHFDINVSRIERAKKTYQLLKMSKIICNGRSDYVLNKNIGCLAKQSGSYEKLQITKIGWVSGGNFKSKTT